jgi:nitrate reductase NapA
MSACNRRQFLRASAAATTAVAAGLSLSDELLALTAPAQEPMSWDRGVCRFCGTGCGIEIATQGDRLTTPFLRMKNGRFAKDGDFVPVSWTRAFDEMAAQFKRVYRNLGPTTAAERQTLIDYLGKLPSR